MGQCVIIDISGMVHCGHVCDYGHHHCRQYVIIHRHPHGGSL